MVRMGDHTVSDIRREMEQSQEFIGMVCLHTENEHAIHYVDMAREKLEKALSLLNAEKSDNDTPHPRRHGSASGKHQSF